MNWNYFKNYWIHLNKIQTVCKFCIGCIKLCINCIIMHNYTQNTTLYTIYAQNIQSTPFPKQPKQPQQPNTKTRKPLQNNNHTQPYNHYTTLYTICILYNNIHKSCINNTIQYNTIQYNIIPDLSPFQSYSNCYKTITNCYD